MWKALNGWGKGNLFKLNKFIHTREARGTGVTAQSGGARPSPHFPGPGTGESIWVWSGGTWTCAQEGRHVGPKVEIV